MRTLATDTTADQLLDYLASDRSGGEWTYYADSQSGNRSITCWMSGISSAAWRATSLAEDWLKSDRRPSECCCA